MSGTQVGQQFVGSIAGVCVCVRAGSGGQSLCSEGLLVLPTQRGMMRTLDGAASITAAHWGLTNRHGCTVLEQAVVSRDVPRVRYASWLLLCPNTV